MKQTYKVVKWELKKNLTNKTFLISIVLTPLIIILFSALPVLLGTLETTQISPIYVVDEMGVFETLKANVNPEQFALTLYEGDRGTLKERVMAEDGTSFIIFDEKGFRDHSFTLYSGVEAIIPLGELELAVNNVLQAIKLERLGIDRELGDLITAKYYLSQTSLLAENVGDEGLGDLNRLIPGIFAGMILFSVFISGTMAFQSATQEKRDKMSEVLLSSVSSWDLMQGKIIGSFFLGLIQVGVWSIVGIGVTTYQFDFPVLNYLFVPGLPLMLLYVFIGYLMFSALFVSMGATINDIYAAGNFQGVLFLIPLLPVLFFGAVMQNPHGVVAMVGSYFPLSTSGVMVLRLVRATSVPTVEIISTLGILIVTTLLIMRMAGKIFKTASLMYGKNATPAEIFRWIRQ